MANNKSQQMRLVRGTKDLFGEEIQAFNNIIDAAKKLASNFGFGELQTPIFEFSEIFERNLGEGSDIISKEVYKFMDRGDNFLTLRPEFTASIVRAFISNGELQQILPQKFFSYGPVFRYDRPQLGRQRQFNQINFEVFGEENPYLDAEIIALATLILKELKIFDKTKLQINSLGCSLTKEKYEIALKNYFMQFQEKLSADSKTRLEKNPLRILDSKDLGDIEIVKNAPKISAFYSNEAKKRFDEVLWILDNLKIPYEVNERLVRGLDYYTSTVFEFVMIDKESAQNTVLAGGRYDELIEKMGGKKTAAIGFAAGVERLMLLQEFAPKILPKISMIHVDENQKKPAFEICQNLRENGFVVDFVYEGNFKKQMKKASQNDARFVLILGEDEILKNEITIKDFKNSGEVKIKIDALLEFFLKK